MNRSRGDNRAIRQIRHNAYGSSTGFQMKKDRSHEKLKRSEWAGHRASGRWLPWVWTVLGVAFVVGVFVLGFWPVEESAAKNRAPKLNASAAPGKAPEGMAWVPGGWFWMGDGEFPDAQPEHLVYVDGFW